MVLKNVLVYQNGEFVKKDLHVEGKFFVSNSSGLIFDFSGMYLMPGFVDSHAHILGVGHKYGYLNLEQIDSQEKLLNLIKNCNDAVIKGRGWSEQILGGYPDKNLLDQINKPVILKRRCGHIAVLNKAAMSVVRIYKNDGIFKENELDLIEEKLKDENPEKFFKIGEQKFLEHGVTFVHSDDLHGISWDQLKKILMNSRIRIFEKLYFPTINDLIEFDDFGDLTEKVYVKGVKIFADGSLGGKTAYLSLPYPDEVQYRGVKLLDSDQIENFARVS
ncbi:MAG TPA: amidohydrolase family protein, partial [Pseudothermotoga sp.]